MRTAIWSPQPRQAEFLSRAEYEVLYGGAAGGGKSDALVAEALRQVNIPHYKGLILRKTYPELGELIDKSLSYYARAFPGAKFNASAHTWTFPSGARVIFGALQHSKDKTKYQGRAFDFIAFDELTHFTWEEYSYLLSRNRPSGAGTRTYVRATANPGGVGHGWVKDRFVTAATPGSTIWEKVAVKFPDGTSRESWRSRAFIPASVFDNKALLDNDPEYVEKLAMLPTAERDALLYGDWNTFSGQVFREWRDDAAHYADRINTHVIDPFRIPSDWAIWCGLDWGYSRPFSVGWYAADHERRLYRIKEWYGCSGTPNQGVKLEPTAVARKIKEIEEHDENLKGRRIHRVGDPAIWGSDGTESIGALMERERVYFERGDNARIDGKMQIHHRLSFDDDGIPMLYVFNTCTNLIRTLPALVYSAQNVEDVDTDGEDHAYDELRYVAMKNPIAPRVKKAEKAREYNPFEDDQVTTYDRYEFYRRR